MVLVVQEGPWGGSDGSVFDTGIVSKFSGFEVWFDDYINGIQFFYEQESKRTSSKVFGRKTESFAVIHFKSHEVLTGIQGTLDLNSKGDLYVVRSLTFFTNFTQYGPFGYEKGSSSFSFKTTKIVGFFGREQEDAINAIGINIEI